MLAQVPEDGQVDSIPPSTLPMPAQQAVRVAVEEAVEKTEPTFEINMEESIPPTPINRQMDSVIQEVSADEIIDEDDVEVETQANADADGFEADSANVNEADVVEITETQDAETQEAVVEEIESADVIEEASTSQTAQARYRPCRFIECGIGKDP